MCLYPRLIKNAKYSSNKKNKGIIPVCKDERTMYVPIGCGYCIECMKQKTRQWQVRLNEERKSTTNGHMVTLTFDQVSLDYYHNKLLKSKKYSEKEINEIATLAIRDFLERWRYKYGKSLKHWFITEMGHNGTERLHIHGIVFTDKIDMIEPIWENGIIHIGTFFTAQTINYIVKYITKIDEKHPWFRGKIHTSPGIGKNYMFSYNARTNKFNKNNTREYYVQDNGSKINLPIYYRNKLYTEEQREQLWLQKLDKQEIFVMGQKIDISKSFAEYDKLLEHLRHINKIAGYAKLPTHDEIKQYKKLRKLLNSGYINNKYKNKT